MLNLIKSYLTVSKFLYLLMGLH